jgi:arabinofuranosyltransferase
VRAARAGDRRALVALTALPVAGLVNALYVVRLGGDYMHGRLLLPAVFALVVPVAAVPVRAPRSPRRIVVLERAVAAGVAAVVAVWATISVVHLRPSPFPTVPNLFSSDAHAGDVRLYGEHAVTAADRGVVAGSPLVPDPDVAVFIEGPVDGGQRRPDGRQIYGAYGIGVVGYTLGPDAYVLDLLGLADPLVSRFELERPGTTGHEKPIPAAWLAARVTAGPVDPDRFPTPVVMVALYESPPGLFDRDTDAARRALGCGDLADLERAVGEPLTVGRFLSNLVAATHLTRLTVPPDPVEAEERLCG